MDTALNVAATAVSGAKTKRLLSLDVMRGMTIVGMIIVNNAGGPLSYDSLRHSAWNGLTPCDLVFPFFLFIMGVTTYLSLAKAGFALSGGAVRKVVVRAAMIIFIGWVLHWVELACDGEPLAFSRLRLTGVLPRIGLCFGIVALAGMVLRVRAMAWLAVALLTVYALMMALFNGYAQDATNFNSVIDRMILGADHLYRKSPVDPEGLAATISAVAHTIIGFCCGAVIKSKDELPLRILRLFLYGFLLMCAGFLLSEAFPINKRVWSPTFVLVTTGLAAMLLGALIYVVDMEGRKSWTRFFEAFGVNPLFLYVVSELLAIFMGAFGDKGAVYSGILSICPDPYAASAIYSVSFMLITGALAYPLYKKRIYLKL